LGLGGEKNMNIEALLNSITPERMKELEKMLGMVKVKKPTEKKPKVLTTPTKTVVVRHDYICLLCGHKKTTFNEVVVRTHKDEPLNEVVRFDVHGCPCCRAVLTNMTKESIIDSIMEFIEKVKYPVKLHYKNYCCPFVGQKEKADEEEIE